MKHFILALVVLVAACNGGTRRNITLGEGTQYTNNSGDSHEVRLPDGSRVVMRPGTQLKVAKGFGKDNRDLELDGEAIFNVVGSAGRPMVLRTRNLEITVLGTLFHVDAFRKNAGEQVDLLEGKLRVRKTYHSDTDNEPEVLESGDMVMINRDIDLMEKEKMSPSELEKVKAMK
ncbi:MAG: FecR domain-containing protein [Bacteroidetes bacterium]|nr:FecR domain-containing protein [Bacteroidota bacterium]